MEDIVSSYKEKLKIAQSNYEACTLYKSIGNYYYENKSYDLALQNYDNALNKIKYVKELNIEELNIYKSNILYNIGNTYFMMYQFKEAEYYYTQAIDLNKGNKNAYIGRSDVRSIKKDYSKALYDLKQASNIIL